MTASAEERSFLTALISGGRRPDITGTMTSCVSSSVGPLFSASGMRPYSSSGMERLLPRRRVSPGMSLTSSGSRSSAFSAATRGRVGMMSSPQRTKRGNDLPLSLACGEQVAVFHDRSQRAGFRGYSGFFPTSLSARGNWSVFPMMLPGGMAKCFQPDGRDALRDDSLI